MGTRRALLLCGLIGIYSPAPTASFAPPAPPPFQSATRRSATPTAAPFAPAGAGDPFALVQRDVGKMKRRIKRTVATTLDSKDQASHPLMQEATRSVFERRERAFRPVIVLLMSRALPPVSSSALDRLDVVSRVDTYRKQRKLAEIVEMMATAQHVHDDVLEDDQTHTSGRDGRGNFAHKLVGDSAGNKVSVLAGDFLLARSSVGLALLDHIGVVEVMAQSLESMVHGEILHGEAQMGHAHEAHVAAEQHAAGEAAPAPAAPAPPMTEDAYVKKVTLKTGALIADSCKSTALLAGHIETSAAAYASEVYGRHLGIAYQITADVTAWRRLRGDADAASAAAAAKRLGVPDALFGTARAAALARTHAERAAAAAASLPESPYRDALLAMCDYVTQENQPLLTRRSYVKPSEPTAAAGKVGQEQHA